MSPKRTPSTPTLADPAPRRIAATVPAQPASASSVRHEVTAFARAHGADRQLAARVALCVTEAVTNAILHAYPDRSGVVSYAARVRRDALEVVVADQGCGIRSGAPSGGLGVGMRLIAEETDDLRIERRRPRGLKLTMIFVLA